MREPSFDKKFFRPLILLFWLLTVVVDHEAQEPGKPETQTDKATLFWTSSPSPRWDLSEEPGVFIYVEQLRSKRPRDKVVYIAYGPLGEVAWYLLSIKNWLKRVTPVEENQIHTFDGGREKELRYEAWLVPEGVEMPKVAGPPAEDEKAVLEFTKYYYPGMCDYCYGQGRLVLKALAEVLKQKPQRKAYLEFYGCGSGRWRRSSDARLEMLKAKEYLIKENGVASSRIFVKLGKNSKRSCEAHIWLLPPHLNSLSGR